MMHCRKGKGPKSGPKPAYNALNLTLFLPKFFISEINNKPDAETDEFSIQAGVLQGDTLAPYIFIVVLDYCLRTAIDGREEHLGFTIKPRKIRRIGPLNITDLDFPDDIALLSDTAKQAQEILNRVELLLYMLDCT